MGTLDLTTPQGLLTSILPESILVVLSLVVVLMAAWNHTEPRHSRMAGWASLVSLGITAAVTGWLWSSGAHTEAIGGMIGVDSFRFLAELLILLAAAGTILLSLTYLEREQMTAPEYYPLILFAVIGMLFMVVANDLIVVFLGLETMSVSVYVLAAFDRRSERSAEAGLKYFLVGAFASAFLLYGIALVYGATGVTNLSLIGAQLGGGPLPLLAGAGLGLLLIGFGFKVAAAPFHMWAPDVYDGAPTPVTTFMATAVKAAGFLTLARVLLVAFPDAMPHWKPILGVLGVLTMVIGNLVALVQRSLKRMLAYSSVAHAGYLLLALVPGSILGTAALQLYLLAYTLTTLIAFGTLAFIGRGGEREVTLSDIAGLGRTRPVLALAIAICMLSLLGFPGTLGFIGKWYILLGLISTGHPVLAVIMVLATVVSAGYYLPIIMAMYMREPAAPMVHAEVRVPVPARIVFAVSAVVLLAFGLWPAPILDLAATGAHAVSAVLSGAMAGQ
ncbi:MAG: NADH-quinone oxidoreductase subunit N [Gemmatimonadota bacterium]